MTAPNQTIAETSAASEERRIARTSILVAATLRVGAQSLAVRIRNMSATGALIEGAVLPLPQIAVELLRGELTATGRVAWVDGNRCGVALDQLIAVDCWISGKASPHQSLVDGMIAQARRAIAAASADANEPNPGGRPDVVVGEELDSIIALLAALSERLAEDPEVVAAHLVQLQALDEAQQRLTALRRPA